MNTGEHLVYSNKFGIITNKKVALSFGPRLREIPVENIEAIRFEKKKSPFLASASLTICVVFFIYVIFNFRYLDRYSILAMEFISGFCFATFLFILIGQHSIVVNTKDKKHETISINLFKLKEGRLFVERAGTVIT